MREIGIRRRKVQRQKVLKCSKRHPLFTPAAVTTEKPLGIAASSYSRPFKERGQLAVGLESSILIFNLLINLQIERLKEIFYLFQSSLFPCRIETQGLQWWKTMQLLPGCTQRLPQPGDGIRKVLIWKSGIMKSFITPGQHLDTEQHQFYHRFFWSEFRWTWLRTVAGQIPYSGIHLKTGMLKDSMWYHMKIIVVVQQTSIHHRIITFIFAVAANIIALTFVGYHCYHSVSL